jgi:hypothetical protein
MGLVLGAELDEDEGAELLLDALSEAELLDSGILISWL